jgi:Xaa-Pro aminopeptidase
VLQGNIGLDRCVFPTDTPGMAIDAMARAPLWREGLDYLHGTGHGVGATGRHTTHRAHSLPVGRPVPTAH